MRCMIFKLSSVLWTVQEWRALHVIRFLAHVPPIYDLDSATLLFSGTVLLGA
jgi:hypothetical protein